MAITVHCDIVSAEETMFSGLVELVVAAGKMGDLGIAPGHAPLLTELKPGPVRVIKQNGEEEVFFVTGGFMEVQPNLINVLADTALRGEDLDAQAAEEARQAHGDPDQHEARRLEADRRGDRFHEEGRGHLRRDPSPRVHRPAEVALALTKARSVFLSQ